MHTKYIRYFSWIYRLHCLYSYKLEYSLFFSNGIKITFTTNMQCAAAVLSRLFSKFIALYVLTLQGQSESRETNGDGSLACTVLSSALCLISVWMWGGRVNTRHRGRFGLSLTVFVFLDTSISSLISSCVSIRLLKQIV